MATFENQESLEVPDLHGPESFQILTEPLNKSSLFHHLFCIDLRSLAVLRIALGAIIVLTSVLHLNHVQIYFSESGMLPQVLNQQILGPGYWSLFWVSESPDFANTLIVILAMTGVTLALGFQTWWCNLICLVLLWSLQVRNPLILTGGEVLLRMLLFWSLFLPMNAVWSIDSFRSEDRPRYWTVSSVATLAIMFQVVYMYFFSGIAKLNPFWLTGDATEYALHLEMSVKPFGAWISEQTGLLYLVTYAVVVAEVATLLLMFVPRLNQFARGALMGFFWMMHLGIWFTMSIGFFSATAIIAWLVFIPSDVWNAIFGQPVGFHQRNLEKSNKRPINRIGGLICFLFFIYITTQNILFSLDPEVGKRLSSIQQFGCSTMTIQKFQMFSQPPLFSPWYEYSAELQDGSEVDLFDVRHKNVGGKPESVYGYLKNQSWRRIHWNLISHPLYPPNDELVYHAIRQRLLNKMVERWDNEHFDNPVIEARLVCHLEPIRLQRNGSLVDVPFKNHDAHELVWATYERKSSVR